MSALPLWAKSRRACHFTWHDDSGRQLRRPRFYNGGLSFSAERVVKNDGALCAIHHRAW